jgi:glyoxylase-like metal-dependent hydrolase (beta-lactamase superfamily II)
VKQLTDSGEPGTSRNLTLQALMAAARWPDASPRVVLTLVGQLNASRRYDEAYAYFDELARQNPDRPLLLAAAGSFQARLAGQAAEAVGKLDAAVAASPGLPNYLRGMVLSRLPAELGRTQDAVSDLEFVLARPTGFPIGLRRPAYAGLGNAYRLLGRDEESAEALRKAQVTSDPDMPPLTADFWVTEQDGFRFVPPALSEPAAGIHLAQGYDLSDIAFVVTDSSLVVIDAASTSENMQAALDAVRAKTALPVSHVILTHAHWDHIGGLAALLGPGVEVIAQAGFAAEQELQNFAPRQWRRFIAAGHGQHAEVVPDRLISEPEKLTVGGVDFHLLPVHGGETDDALMIHLPERGVLFTGDVTMPYLGEPISSEGSVTGLIDTLRLIEELQPSLLLHGHPPLTAYFAIDAIPALRAAVEDLHEIVLADIRAGRSVFEILERNHLPAVLRSNPNAVMPYVVLRDNLIRRVQRQRTGYWQPDPDSLDPVSPNEWAAVLDLLTDGDHEVYVRVIERLLDRDDLPAALRLADLALANHPGNDSIARLRHKALLRLVERNQVHAFKFLAYSELAGLTIPAIDF